MAGTQAEAVDAQSGRLTAAVMERHLTGPCGGVWPLAMSGHGAGGVGQPTARAGACGRVCAGRDVRVRWPTPAIFIHGAWDGLCGGVWALSVLGMGAGGSAS